MSAISKTVAGEELVQPAPLLRVRGIAKAFGTTQALRDASFELLDGEVHALVGENGSGKSTLVKVLSGVHSPDAGSIDALGRKSVTIRAPRAAVQMGIVTVFQEVLVAEACSVFENVWLGKDGPLRARTSEREKRSLASSELERLVGRELELDKPIEELALSDRQACCIVRALLRRPRVLILDEATSALDVATRDRLFATLIELSREGLGVIFISHRMDEISEIGDRITVMRSGETVATLERNEWTPQELVHLMSGADRFTARARIPNEVTGTRRPVLSATQLCLAPHHRTFDLDVHAGELIGVAGLEGHGQEELLHALRGARVVGGTIVRRAEGRDAVVDSVRMAARQGIAYVPRERRQALFTWMSIRENFGMRTLVDDQASGWLMPRRTRARLAAYVAQLGVVLGKPDDPITTLSGGNQQKIVIARWLAAKPSVLLLNDPTRGIDIGTKRELYDLLLQLAQEGLAIVMLSTEVDEHIELMDRVLVFREHQLLCEFERGDLTRQKLVSAFFGEV